MSLIGIDSGHECDVYESTALKKRISKHAFVLETAFLQTADHPGVFRKGSRHHLVHTLAKGMIPHQCNGLGAQTLSACILRTKRDVEVAAPMDRVEIPEDADADGTIGEVANAEDDGSFVAQIGFDRLAELILGQFGRIVGREIDHDRIVIPAQPDRPERPFEWAELDTTTHDARAICHVQAATPAATVTSGAREAALKWRRMLEATVSICEWVISG